MWAPMVGAFRTCNEVVLVLASYGKHNLKLLELLESTDPSPHQTKCVIGVNGEGGARFIANTTAIVRENGFHQDRTGPHLVALQHFPDAAAQPCLDFKKRGGIQVGLGWVG